MGSYGVNCIGNCSLTCRLPKKCDRVTGHCYGGCQRGWTGVRCEKGKRYRNTLTFEHGNAFIFLEENTQAVLSEK